MSHHIPVMSQEIVAGLAPRPGGRYIDCTVGMGGHAAALLAASAPDGRLLALDTDPAAIAQAAKRLAAYSDRVLLVQANFRHLTAIAQEHGFTAVQGVLLDLGLSLDQLNDSQRGFSFRHDGPLDMRFDPSQSLTAAEIVNTWSVHDLAEIIHRFGEERHFRRIAKAIVAHRPIHSTGELVRIIVEAVGPSRLAIHPATRTFQALRIAVNDELGALAEVLPQAVDLLAPGGRIAVISFHSLEDRLVKRFFQREATDCLCPPDLPVCTCGHRARLIVLTRRPQRPKPAEIERNPRCRSARLRVAMRKPD